MRTAVLILLVLTTSMSAQNRSAAPAAPCTTATDACTEWVALGGGPARSLIYRTRSLDARNDNVRRALIMVHGTNRNADHYFTTAAAAAFIAGALDDSVVISPRIASAAGNCRDALAPNEVSWSCTGDSWRSGGNAVSHPDLTSFDFVDQILRKLANKNTFPNLRAIVVAGHSAGGQFVARYQMANRVHDSLGVPITYVVANPSSYAWPDASRPQPVGDAAPDAAKGAWETEKVHTNFTYGSFDGSVCQHYNRWPAGLAERTGGYTAKTSDEQLKKQLVSRPTTFLFGQVDTLPLGGFDSSCPAMAQGATRRARGEAYVKYINETLGAKHAVQIVPECGHNDRCVYTTDAVLPVIFPSTTPPRPTPPTRDPHTAGYVTATELPDGTMPSPDADGNFIIGPTHNPAPEMTAQDGVPHGAIWNLTMSSADSKIYPGIAREPGTFGTADPTDPAKLVVTTSHPAPYTRRVTVYVPKQYVAGTAAPFIIGADGPDQLLFTALDSLIAQKRVPVMIAISIGNGSGDAQGSQRGLEYDTMSGRYAEFVETEVLPLVERECHVKLTSDPEGRATMGGSSGGSAALSMAWYHPEWYHRVLTYSGTYVNQQWPANHETPHGAWEYHERLIPNSARKPIRIWMEVGDRDLLNPNVMRDNMHDWVLANENMARVLAAKGYRYQFVFARNAGHTDRAVKQQTLPEALEWLWKGYR